jgi:hypothetical protein
LTSGFASDPSSFTFLLSTMPPKNISLPNSETKICSPKILQNEDLLEVHKGALNEKNKIRLYIKPLVLYQNKRPQRGKYTSSWSRFYRHFPEERSHGILRKLRLLSLLDYKSNDGKVKLSTSPYDVKAKISWRKLAGAE